MGNQLLVSLVVYRSPMAVLSTTLESLAQAAGAAKRQGYLGSITLVLMDNDPQHQMSQCIRVLLSRSTMAVFDQCRLLDDQGNVGYGAGHNRALGYSGVDYHLVLNPDVILSPDTLSKALVFMARHPEVGLLAPRVNDEQGGLQYLCKRYPSVWVLLLRGFAPARLRHRFSHALHTYEMRDVITAHHVVWDVPIVSGCFMFLRSTVMQQLAGFDTRFFLYFEDFDLSLRVARVSRSVYVPSAQITHLGGQTARKGWRHVGWFVRSMVKFFNCHGWKWY